jgi:hypothetical protein
MYFQRAWELKNVHTYRVTNGYIFWAKSVSKKRYFILRHKYIINRLLLSSLEVFSDCLGGPRLPERKPQGCTFLFRLDLGLAPATTLCGILN